MNSRNVSYRNGEVEFSIGPGVALRLPMPPEGDDYDYTLLIKYVGEVPDPSRFLLSARRPQAPEQVAPRSWRRPVAALVIAVVMVLATYKVLGAQPQRHPDTPKAGCKLINTHLRADGAFFQLSCAVPVPDSVTVYPKRLTLR
jgi:hypothetical protein